MVGIPLPQTALRGRFFRSGDATSRRGGSGVDVGHPVWGTGREGPKGAHIAEARRAATRAPTPLHTAPAPTRYPTLLQKPTCVRPQTR